MTERYCVLIPSYNEAKAIGGLVAELRKRHLIVYVVDDGSTDDTAGIAERAGAVVVKHKVNKGKGASLREGFRHVLKKGFEAVFVMDGDNQHEVDDLDHFLRAMNETNADMIIGNRMADTSTMPLSRRKTNRFMSGLISRICGQEVPDTQCGFRLIKRQVLEAIHLESSNYEIESEMIIRAARKGFRLASVPITTIYEDEESKINPVIDTLRFIRFLIKVLVRP